MEIVKKIGYTEAEYLALAKQDDAKDEFIDGLEKEIYIPSLDIHLATSNVYDKVDFSI